MNYDNIMSLVRTALKVGGTLMVAYAGNKIGQGQIDALSTAIEGAVGGTLTAAGIFWSFWHHTPDAPASASEAPAKPAA